MATLLAVVAIGLAFGYVIARSGGGSASAGPDPLPRTDGPLIVYSEFAPDADTLYAADPADPSQRARLATVPHAANYAIVAALSPDGGRVAYTVLPPSIAGPANDAPAQLWLLDLASGDSRLLAEGVDLPVAPVWSPAGDAVAVRRSVWSEADGGHFEIVLAGLDGSQRTAVTSEAGLFPAGFAPDGATLYFAALSAGGTDLGRVALDGGAAEAVAHLSDGFARDWRLSPNGARLAYLAPPEGSAAIAYEARVLDLATGATDVPLGAHVEQFGPVWDAGGALTVGRLTEGAGGAAATVAGGIATDVAPPGTGFDAPLSWSPDGRYLAVRAFEGASLSDPGPSRIVAIGPDGVRRELSRLSDVSVLGWWEPAR